VFGGGGVKVYVYVRDVQSFVLFDVWFGIVWRDN
jgi:hypothetical protein